MSNAVGFWICGHCDCAWDVNDDAPGYRRDEAMRVSFMTCPNCGKEAGRSDEFVEDTAELSTGSPSYRANTYKVTQGIIAAIRRGMQGDTHIKVTITTLL